jgi:DNA-binding NtrC family response regulator
LQALAAYDWPGNVRELANVLERAQILAEGDSLTAADLPEGVTAGAEGRPAGDPGHLREVERRHIQEVLRRHNGNKVRAARALGISRRALHRLIRKYQLEARPVG